MEEQNRLNPITFLIIKCFYNVYNTLGYGFLEKVYEKALCIELQNKGLNVERQKPIQVWYNNQIVGDYFADIIVNEKVIIELKTADSISEQHENQLINYLKSTNLEIGLLLNFGKKPEIRRKIFTNNRKNRSFV